MGSLRRERRVVPGINPKGIKNGNWGCVKQMSPEKAKFRQGTQPGDLQGGLHGASIAFSVIF